MEKCNWCDQDKTSGNACVPSPIRFPDGVELEQIRFGPDRVRCKSCGVLAGSTHHEDCKQELCPRCKTSLVLSCSCLDRVVHWNAEQTAYLRERLRQQPGRSADETR